MEAELQLIDKVELRITLASSTEKFQQNLNVFLAPLLLKLASPYTEARARVLKFVSHLMLRINSSPSVALPVEKLLSQARAPADAEKPGAADFAQVKLYSYLFAAKGLEREKDAKVIVSYIPMVIECIGAELALEEKRSNAVLARGFGILLKLLAKLEEKKLKLFEFEFPEMYQSPQYFTTESLKLTTQTAALSFILEKFSKLFLLSPKPSSASSANGPLEYYYCPGLSNKEVKFFTYDAGASFTYQQLTEIKFKVLVLLSLCDLHQESIIHDAHFFLLLLFANVDSSSSVHDTASSILKKIDINEKLLNNNKVLTEAIDYYLGNSEKKSVAAAVQATLISSIFLKSSKILTFDQKKLSEISLRGLDSMNLKLKKISLLFSRYIAVNLDSFSSSTVSPNSLEGFNRKLAKTVLESIQAEGWPKLQVSGVQTSKIAAILQNRRLMYESLADLVANEMGLLLNSDLTYLKFFFNSLKGEQADNVSVVKDALAKLINNFTLFFHGLGHTERKLELEQKLKLFFRDFLARDIDNNVDLDGDIEMTSSAAPPSSDIALSSCRYLALKFVNALFKYDDVEARFLNIYGSLKTNRYDVLETSEKGLNPFWFNINKASVQSDQNSKTTKELLGLDEIKLKFPTFNNLVKQLQKEIQYQKKYPNSSVLSQVLLPVFEYLLDILVMQSVEGKNTVIAVDNDWHFRVTKSLELDEKVRSLIVKNLQLISSDDQSNALFLYYLQLISDNYFSKNVFDAARTYTRDSSNNLGSNVHLFNQIYNNVIKFGSVFNSIVSLSSSNVLHQVATREKVDRLLDIIDIGIQSPKDKFSKTFYARLVQEETIDTLSKTIGVLVSSSNATVSEYQNTIVAQLISPLDEFMANGNITTINTDNSSNDFVVARINVTCNVIGHLGLTGKVSHTASTEMLTTFLPFFYKSLKFNYDCNNWKHYEVLLSGLNELAKYGVLRTKNAKLAEIIQNIKDLVLAKVKKCDEKSVFSWALLSLVAPDTAPQTEEDFNSYVKAVYDTHFSKQTEYLFSSGEALSVITCGWDAKVLVKTLDIQGFGVDHLKDLAPADSTASLESVVSLVLKGCANSKPALRKASCIWLLSLVQYCGHLEPVSSKVREIQVAFMRYLADNDDLVQESASTGLSLVYEIGDSDLKESLVKGLMKSFTSSSGTAKLTAGSVSADTELFEPGVLNTPDGSISTYKDILNLASDVGDPSLVYKFMSLTKSSALWASRKGIAFGLGNIMSKANLEKSLQSNDELTKRLIVKLYRYKFDPNENVARSMGDIWNILIPKSSKIIELNYDIILKELLAGIGNREWRVRQATTTALIDLLQILQINKYEDNLEEIWILAFRAMDDIKDSVRDSGTNLVKFLANNLINSIENADKEASSKKDYNKLLGKLIPFLISTKGILSSVNEVRSYSLSIILKLCMRAGNVIKPFIPGLIEELLILMSTLEPQMANYLALNADKYNLKVSDIDAQRLNSVGHSSMMEAVERMLDLLDDDLMKPFIAELNSAIKKSVGLPSKVASSKVIVTLVVKKLPLLNEQYSAALLKTCTAQLNDRNQTVAITYANAAGYLCRACKVTAIVKYGKVLQDLYFDHKSEQDRKIAATGIDSIAKHSTDKFQSVASFFLPLAFVCQNDDVAEIAGIFKNVWIENTGSKSAVKLYIDEISNVVSDHLQSQQYSMRQVCAKAIATACTSMSGATLKTSPEGDNAIVGLNEQLVRKLFSILIEACRGRAWKGKEVVLDALVTFMKNFKTSLRSDSDLYSKIEKIMLTEAKRRNKDYQKNALKSLAKFVTAFPSDKLYSEELSIIEPFFKDRYYEDSDSDDDDDDSDYSSRNKKVKTDMHRSKSSAVNLEREANSIQLLETLATSFTIDKETGILPSALTDFFFTKAIPFLFNSAHLTPTWRTKIAICEKGSSVLESIINYNDTASANKANVGLEPLEKLYETVKVQCLNDMEIENVRVQASRTIDKILKVVDEGSSEGKKLKKAIVSDLQKHVSKKESSTIVKVEVEKVIE